MRIECALLDQHGPCRDSMGARGGRARTGGHGVCPFCGRYRLWHPARATRGGRLTMTRRSWWSRLPVGALLGTLLVARPSSAACPNQCTISVAASTAEPPLACATVTSSAEDCNCGVALRVLNRCSTAIDAQDFSFDACWTGSDAGHGCSSLAPSFQGMVTYRLAEPGVFERQITLRDADGDHVVDVRAEVSGFVDGGCSGCATTRAAGRHTAVLGLVAALLATARRRERRSTVSPF